MISDTQNNKIESTIHASSLYGTLNESLIPRVSASSLHGSLNPGFSARDLPQKKNARQVRRAF